MLALQLGKTLEKTQKFDFEFLVLLYLNIFAIEPDLLTQYITPKLHYFIISLLLEVLDMQKVLATNIYQFSQFFS